MSPTQLADKVGGKTLVVVDHPVANQGDADDLADARAGQIGSAAFEATAVVDRGLEAQGRRRRSACPAWTRR